MKLLIDADILLYTSASAVENEVEFEEDVWVMWTDENEAIEAFDTALGGLLSRANTYSYLLCFSGSNNFRKKLYPDYKGNRQTRKPMGFKAIKERIFADPRHKCAVQDTLEADDLIGIYATRSPDDTIIWSADKDLQQIPGKHLTEAGIETISDENADLWFYTQILTGDTADNYKGCPGIGPVKAANILRLSKGMDQWSFILKAYENAGLTEEEALVQARLARILRHTDWDEEKQEVKLWVPSSTSK